MELIDRESIEKRYLKEFEKLSGRHRKELINLMGNPPDFRNVPLSFWKKVDQETAAILIILLSDVHKLNSVQHGLSGQLASELANRYASKQSALIAKEYAKNSLARAMQTQATVLQNKETLTRQKAKEFVGNIFGNDRSERLVTTEFTSASVGGGEAAMKTLGKTTANDLWITHPSRSRSGVCSRCAPFHMTTRRLWERVFPLGPPVHPRCCCEIQYELRW